MAATSTPTDVAGPAGRIEAVIDVPGGTTRGVAVLCHPHPVHGGTMDNKVIQTLARAFVQLGYRAVRFNFRGVGRSQGQWDHGVGEVDDALAVVAACRDAASPLVLGGFSFGGYVAAQAAERLAAAHTTVQRVVLVGPGLRCRRIRWSFTARPTTWCRCARPSTGRVRRDCRSSSCPAWGTISMAS